MIFVEWTDRDDNPPNKKRGTVLGWAHDGAKLHAVVLVGDKGYDVPLSDMTFIEDITKRQARKRRKK